MKIQIPVKELKDAVMRMSRIAAKNTTLPVLQCLLIEGKKNTVVIRATNLEVGAEVTLNAKSVSEGTVAVPAHILASVLQTVSEQEVMTLTENEGGNIEVKTERTNTMIKSYPTEDFPTLPSLSGSPHFLTIPASSLLKGVRTVATAAAVSDIRPELASVYIYPKQTTVMFAGTDTVRLAEQAIPVRQKPDIPDEGILIPAKNAVELSRFFENESGNVDIKIGESQIRASSDGTLFTSRIIDGSFPDYEQIIPKESKTEAVLLKKDLEQALKTGSTFINTHDQAIISCVPDKGTCMITTQNPDIGEAHTNIPGTISGEDVKITCNHRFFSDALPLIPEDSVVITFNGSDRPIMIRGKGTTAFTYLVMPMQE